ARANPVASALLDTVVRFRLPVAALVELIDARAFDLRNDPMPTIELLEAYADRTSSALIDLAVRILHARALAGYEGRMAAVVHAAGKAYAIAGLLRAFPWHAARGQLYVPLEILERHGAAPADVLAGRATPEIAAALAAMRLLARTHFAGYREAAA